MPKSFGKIIKLKCGDTKIRVMVAWQPWCGETNVSMLMNMHRPTAEGGFHDEHGNALKPAIVQDCTRHKGLYSQIGLCNELLLH